MVWEVVFFMAVSAHASNFGWTYQNISWSSDHCLEDVRKAFRWWQSSDGVFDFYRVRELPDIQIEWKENTTIEKLGHAHTATAHLPAQITMFVTECGTSKVYTTLIHEIGHALGLPHDSSVDSIMYRFNQNRVPLSMNERERHALQQIYGCYWEADALGKMWEHLFYAFKGDRYRIVSRRYPRHSTEHRIYFLNVSHVNAFYEEEGHRFILVSNDTYYLFDYNYTLLETGTLAAKYGISGRVDAACRFRDRHYLFSGSDVYVNGTRHDLARLFFRAPSYLPLKGAWQKRNKTIRLVDRFYYQWIYDKNFRLKKIVSFPRRYPRLICDREKRSLGIVRQPDVYYASNDSETVSYVFLVLALCLLLQVCYVLPVLVILYAVMIQTTTTIWFTIA